MRKMAITALLMVVLFLTGAAYCGDKIDVSHEKARFYRAFLLPKRRFFSVQKHRCKIAVFPLWQDSNSRKLNTKYTGR